MKNNRKVTLGRRVQVVFSKPQYKLVGEYTNKSGQKKNRYVLDETAEPIKVIKHKIAH